MPYNEKQKCGRPVTRWRDEFDKKLEPLWRRVTANKKIWRKSGEVYAQKWPNEGKSGGGCPPTFTAAVIN